MRSTKWYAMYVEYKITCVYHFAKIACRTMISMMKRIKAHMAKYTWMVASRRNTRKSLGNFRAIRVCGRHRVNCHKCTLDFWGRLGAFSSENLNPQSDIQWTPSEFRVNKETGQRKETRRLERIENETHMHSKGTRRHAIARSFSPSILATVKLEAWSLAQRKNYRKDLSMDKGNPAYSFNFFVIFNKFLLS